MNAAADSPVCSSAERCRSGVHNNQQGKDSMFPCRSDRWDCRVYFERAESEGSFVYPQTVILDKNNGFQAIINNLIPSIVVIWRTRDAAPFGHVDTCLRVGLEK